MRTLPTYLYDHERVQPSDYEDVKRKAFFELPFAGNHIELGSFDGVNHLCVFYADGDAFYFSRDESWDNVEYIETAVGDGERKALEPKGV